MMDSHDERKRRNYKLLSDPMIEAGAPKVYRFDGVVPGVRLPAFVLSYCKTYYNIK